MYVLEKVGASVVVHAPGCTDILNPLPRFQEMYPGADPADGTWWFCERCGDLAVRDITTAAGRSEPVLGDHLVRTRPKS